MEPYEGCSPAEHRILACWVECAICRRHCLGSRKLVFAREAGIDPGQWVYGYSDSSLDIPLLAACREPHLVNPREKTVSRVRRALGREVPVLSWS